MKLNTVRSNNHLPASHPQHACDMRACSTCYRGVHVFPLAPVVSQPVARVHALAGEGGAGDDERPLGHDPLQGAGQEEAGLEGAGHRQRLAFYFRVRPGGPSPRRGFSLHEPVEAVHVVVDGLLLPGGGTHGFGPQQSSQHA